MPTPQISLAVFYLPKYDLFAKNPADPSTTAPTAAIITAILPGSPTKVNLTIFPDGRPPVTRESVPYFTDVTAGEPAYKFVDDPNALHMGHAASLATACDPVGYSWKYFMGTLGTGTIIYTDYAMTTPYIARPAVTDFENDRAIYEVNQTTGELTATGTFC